LFARAQAARTQAAQAAARALLRGGLLVDAPRGIGGVLPGPGGSRGSRAGGRLGGADQRPELAALDEGGTLAQHLAQSRTLAGDDWSAARERLHGRQPEALVLRGQHERVRSAVDGRQ